MLSPIGFFLFNGINSIKSIPQTLYYQINIKCATLIWEIRDYTYFPQKSIFCCVIDPGVGTRRKALAVKTEHFYFVGPDNGLLWETLQNQKISEIRQIPVTPQASRTFQGRDVFAKAAARIQAEGFHTVGKKIKQIVKLKIHKKAREGTVVRIDRFGNIITNLQKLQKNRYRVHLGTQSFIMPFFPNYQSAPEDELFLIEGSCQTIEISLKNESANDKLRLRRGMKIKIT